MFSQTDLLQIQKQGVPLDTVQAQIQYFVQGFPYMNVIKAATVGDGIVRVADTQLDAYVADFDAQTKHLDLLQFVPASGAATRMFKSLFAFKDDAKTDKSVVQYCEQIRKFAFFEDLKVAMFGAGLDIEKGIENNDYQTITAYLLETKGLDYGSLPKGLLKFHATAAGTRTAAEEHLADGALYANANGKVAIHFTVSPEHRLRFEALIQSVRPAYEDQYGVKYHISYSEQKPSTDTIAVNPDNTPFRNVDGTLLFRPAGHGALLANLNDQDADVVFTKNIDNVVPESIKPTMVTYKKVLAALLLDYQAQIFDFQDELESCDDTQGLLEDLTHFFETTLCMRPPADFEMLSETEKLAFFRVKLNRPVRVCGMVKNVGEPGGGPFWAQNPDGSTSLQVVESAQIDLTDAAQKTIFEQATHFNPVDLVFSMRDKSGQKFDLMQFRDPLTGFISAKSKDGKELKAQELPGLWNGSMADWNTIFVEVPLITFNPVKTVNDLLRPEHQGLVIN